VAAVLKSVYLRKYQTRDQLLGLVPTEPIVWEAGLVVYSASILQELLLVLELARVKLSRQVSLSSLLFSSSSLFHLSLQSLNRSSLSLSLILFQPFSCPFLSFQQVF